MADSPFLRPGSDLEPSSAAWPYERPQVESAPLGTPTPASSEGSPASPPVAAPPASGRRRDATLVAGLVGLIIGAVAAGLLSTLFAGEPEPTDIVLDVFPDYIGNLERPDLALAKAKNPVDAEEFEAEFEAQREGFQFAYGGDGASVDYGQFLMTIVNGSQSLPLPTDTAGTTGGAQPTLISLDSDSVSCVFRPEVELYNSAVLQSAPDLSATGWTQCVLNDAERRISLKLESRIPGGAEETSTRFAGILERTHTSLVG